MRPNLYDYLKVYAIGTMIIDHIGYFLLPDSIELRVIGRVAFPLFFLLIGRNESRRISGSLIRSALIIQTLFRVTSYIYGYNLRQINILPAAIIIKYCISYGVPFLQSLIAKYTHQYNLSLFLDKMIRFIIIVVCILGVSWTHSWIEYGSMTLGVALLGNSIRHYVHHQGFIAVISFLILYGLYAINHEFGFSTNYRILIIRGWISGIIAIIALSYSNMPLQSSSLRWNNIIIGISRYAVQIYLIHVIILFGIVVVKRMISG